jgi:hypothetical protein
MSSTTARRRLKRVGNYFRVMLRLLVEAAAELL